MINTRYVGEMYAAVTKFKRMYGCVVQLESELLTEQLQDAKKVLPRMSVLKRFDRISEEAVGILENAVRDLEAGKQVDLDRILA